MPKLIPFAVIAAAAVSALSACSTPPQTGGPAEPKIVTNVLPYRAGSGVVQSVNPAPVMPGASASGSTAQPMQRLEIRMDNGTVQYVDVPSREFTRGTRVILTEDKIIRRS
jgi:hypothetical protein